MNKEAMKPYKTLTIVIFFLLFLIIGGTIALTIYSGEYEKNKENNKEDNNLISLTTIKDNFENSSNYEILSEASNITFSIEETDLVVKLEEKETNIVRACNFNLNENILSINIRMESEDAFTCAFVTAYIFDAASVALGNEESKLANYLITSTATENIEVIQTESYVEYKMDLTKELSTNNVGPITFEQLNITEEDINNIVNKTEWSGVFNAFSDQLYLNVHYNNDEITILVAQTNEITELTYETLVNVIEGLYPSEVETFKMNVTTLAPIIYERYSILDEIQTSELAKEYDLDTIINDPNTTILKITK